MELQDTHRVFLINKMNELICCGFFNEITSLGFLGIHFKIKMFGFLVIRPMVDLELHIYAGMLALIIILD